jgi:hypothetical protein
MKVKKVKRVTMLKGEDATMQVKRVTTLNREEVIDLAIHRCNFFNNVTFVTIV